MRLFLLNDLQGFIKNENATENEIYDINEILEAMIGIRTAKDFVHFLEYVPYSFFPDSFPSFRRF